MSKSKIFSLLFLVLLAVFLIPAASANLNITASTLQATHNTVNPGSFTLKNLNDTLSVTNLNCTVTVGTWTTSVSCPTSLSANGSQSVSFTVTVPQFTAAGITSGSILAQGMVNGTTYNSTTQAFNVNVTNSPALTIAWVTSPANIYQKQNTSAIINVSNSGNVAFSSVIINTTNITGSNISFSSIPFILNLGESNLQTINITTSDDTFYGANTISVIAQGTGAFNASASSSANFNVLYRYCGSNSSTSRITISEINNEDDISGEEFDPLDKITVDVEVENSYDEDRTVIVSAVLVFEDKELDDTETETTIEINDDDSESVTFDLTIPADADEGAYYLYIKAYDDDATKYCEQEVISFTVEKSSSHKIVPYELSAEPSNVSCEGIFIVKGKLANIGSYDEDQVKLVYSDGWTSLTKYYDDVDKGDEVEFEFLSAVPKNATEGIKSFTLGMYFNYDEDDEDYEKSESKTYSLLTISGNCVQESKNVSITSELSTMQVFTGSQSEVKVLVTNTGTLKQTYAVEVPTVSWATIGSISPASFELEPGSARYVSVKLTPNANVTGNQSMDVKVSYSGTTQTKTLSLNVQKVSEVSSLIERIKFSVSRDWIWYGIGVIVAVIIVMIFAISSASNKAAAVKAALAEQKIKQYKNY